MMRRILLGVGVVLLVFTMAGIGLLPQSGLQRDEQEATVTLPDSLAPAADPEPVLLGDPTDPASNFAHAFPWGNVIGLCCSVFVVMAGALIVASVRAGRGHPPAAPISPEKAALFAGGGVALGTAMLFGGIFAVGICAVVGYLFFGQSLITSPGQGPSENELTNQYMMTQLAYTATADFQTQSAEYQTQSAGYQPQSSPAAAPTYKLSPNEMTSDHMMTQLAHTETAVFETQSAPTPYIEITPTVKAPTTGQPEPAALTVDWPRQMDTTDTEWVHIVLWRPNQSSYPLYADPFGSDYQGTFDITLSGDGFEIIPDPNYSGPQSLDTVHPGWVWEIRPLPGVTGPRTLSATVVGTWEPFDRQQRETVRRVLARPNVVVNVTDPAIPRGTVAMLALFGGLLGSLLCAPWVSDFFRRRIRRGDG